MISDGDMKSERRKMQGQRIGMHDMFWESGTQVGILTEEGTNPLEKCSVYWIAHLNGSMEWDSSKIWVFKIAFSSTI